MSHTNKPEPISSLFRRNIPNLLTLANMLLGLIVLYLSIGNAGHAVLSCILILIAAVVDAFDGAIARLLGAESDFGKQLDSFADLTTFGLAPIAVLLTLEPIRATPTLLPVLALHPLAGAFRLARFNLGNYTDYFVGLPITAAGSIQACFGLVLSRFNFLSRWVLGSATLLTIALSLLMVSSFKITKHKRGRRANHQ